ncbi:hypothetical protein N805_02690 [Pseudomonas putida S13.1.2]|uniref:Transposase n=1 Tax=Pseudomonas putida S13.1.2 TaxID=1384061 RepID=A0AAU8RRN2_PSEPU|nr:hypothetical protein N805_02690 [Pseudomonas putida S13.1.2]
MLEKANTRIGLLLTVYMNLRKHAGNAFQQTLEPTERYPVPGLHSYKDMVMSLDEIEGVSDIARDHPIKP